MKTAIVDGLEMFAFARAPGAAQCDTCDMRVFFTRIDAPRRLPELETLGWKFSSHSIGAYAICPDCGKT